EVDVGDDGPATQLDAHLLERESRDGTPLGLGPQGTDAAGWGGGGGGLLLGGDVVGDDQGDDPVAGPMDQRVDAAGLEAQDEEQAEAARGQAHRGGVADQVRDADDVQRAEDGAADRADSAHHRHGQDLERLDGAEVVDLEAAADGGV